MSRTRHVEDDDDDTEYRDEEIPTIPCPYCNADILEDTERCPRCENYLSAEDSSTTRRPLWIWVLLILGTLMMIFSAFQ